MTTSPRPFRFGVQMHATDGREAWVDAVRRVEANGYSTITIPDHFDHQLAPVPALQCAIDATTDLRVGALVFDNDYKHPVVLAKELATMDVLSNGRVEAGLGAGWMRSDYEQAGIAYDPPGTRVSRFIEGVRVLRGAFGDGPFDFDGEFYQIAGYNGLPKPVQSHIPLLIGGGGPRVLRFAARNADIVGVNPNLRSGAIDAESIGSMTEAEFDDKVSIVRAAAGDAGRLDDIEINLRCFFVSVTDDVEATIAGTAELVGVEPDMIANSPYALIGSVDRIADRIIELRERWGVSYVIVGQAELDAFAPVVARLAGT